MRKLNRTLIKGTYYLSQVNAQTDNIRSLILRRRLQVLVHSCIYYVFDESIITDSLWQSWADELVELQQQYPNICNRVDYHRYFIGFDGSSGYDLPIRKPEVMSKAKYIMEVNNDKRTINKVSRNRKIYTIKKGTIICGLSFKEYS